MNNILYILQADRNPKVIFGHREVERAFKKFHQAEAKGLNPKLYARSFEGQKITDKLLLGKVDLNKQSINILEGAEHGI